MSKYTIKLSDILRQLYINSKYTKEQQYQYQYDINKMYETSNPIEIVEVARASIFDFQYELYDPAHKEELEKKILYHYYNYEIGEDTYSMFKFNLMKTMNEVMPYYNKIYKAVASDYNYWINVDYTDEDEQKIKSKANTQSNGTGRSNTTSNSTNRLDTTITDNQSDSYEDRLRESDTPQNDLEEVEDGKYVSNYKYNNGTSETDKTNTTESENTSNDTTNGTTQTNNETNTQNEQEQENKRKIYGLNTKQNRSKMLKDYIDNIQNVDMQIIESLKSCFCLLL